MLQFPDDDSGLLTAGLTLTCLLHPTRPQKKQCWWLGRFGGWWMGSVAELPASPAAVQANPHMPRCLQEKQGIHLQAIHSFKLEIVAHGKIICTE